MNNYLEEISNYGIVPVVKIDNIDDALPLAKALIDGGLPLAEVTFRTDVAAQAMKLISDSYPNMLIGAGTVLTTTQVDQAIESGAKFIVSPGLNPKIVKYCQTKDILVLPGCANASDIEQAIELGLNTVKFFPAEPLGGLSMLKALKGPYTQMNFMPTGGINEANLNDYLKEKFIVGCGGTWMIDAKLIASKDFDAIKELTNKAVLKMLGLSLHHIGINPNGDELNISNDFAKLFGQSVQEHQNSYFASNYIEVMKNNIGTNGHIAIGTLSVKRARSYFERLGYKFKEDTARYNNNQDLMSIYFEKEINGFAIHLVQK